MMTKEEAKQLEIRISNISEAMDDLAIHKPDGWRKRWKMLRQMKRDLTRKVMEYEQQQALDKADALLNEKRYQMLRQIERDLLNET
jgi:hypothetical protein